MTQLILHTLSYSVQRKIITSLLWVALNFHAQAQDTTMLIVIRSIPIIQGTLNNKPAYFLIDTGASYSILNEALACEYNFFAVTNKYLARKSALGVAGEFFLKEARSAKLRLGKHEINYISKAVNLDALSRQFADKNISIAGIIGVDILSVLHSKIDLESQIIVFR